MAHSSTLAGRLSCLRLEPSPQNQTAKAAASQFFQVWAGVFGLALFDWLTGLVLKPLHIPLPSFVVAMALVFVACSLGRWVRPEWVDRIVASGTPAAIFLSRWMALFFVPPLVLVPASQAPALKDLLLLILLAGVGFVASFWTAGALAKSLCDGPEVAIAKPWPELPPWPRRPLLLGSSCVACASALLVSVIDSRSSRLIFGVSLSVLAFVGAEKGRGLIARRGHLSLATFCHPVLVSAALIALVWTSLGLKLAEYHAPISAGMSPGWLLATLLRPSVVSLALALDAQRRLLRANARALVWTTLGSALFSLLATTFAAGRLGLDPSYARALVARSVTTPVALSIAERLNANGGIAAIIVIFTGVLGAVLSLPLARRFGFESPAILGIATGSASHGVGTAALAREHPVAAAFSGIAFALVAVWCTALVSIPALRAALLYLL